MCERRRRTSVTLTYPLTVAPCNALHHFPPLTSRLACSFLLRLHALLPSFGRLIRGTSERCRDGSDEVEFRFHLIPNYAANGFRQTASPQNDGRRSSQQSDSLTRTYGSISIARVQPYPVPARTATAATGACWILHGIWSQHHGPRYNPPCPSTVWALRRALAVHGKEADSPELKRPRVSEECESTRCPCVSGTTEYRPVDAYLGWIRLAIENLIVSPREEEQSSCSASPMMHAGWLMIATAKYPS